MCPDSSPFSYFDTNGTPCRVLIENRYLSPEIEIPRGSIFGTRRSGGSSECGDGGTGGGEYGDPGTSTVESMRV